VLTGGGARAAYQVGYLRWVARHVPEFGVPIITGVSAGAINAAFIASFRGTQAEATERLAECWRTLTMEQVFRVDSASLASHVARWGLRLVSGGGGMAPRVRGLVDTTPLRRTLTTTFDLSNGSLGERVALAIAQRRLWALAIIWSNYTTGVSVVWTQGQDLVTWTRTGRRSRATTISLEHVLASAALPIFFPAVELDDGWYGDGGIRLTGPCSPAIHLGATRILALSTQHVPDGTETASPMVPGYPPPLQIWGQLLNAVFLDDLDRDAKELERVNMLLAGVPPEMRRGLRPIRLLVARPSQDLGALVARFEPQLPRLFRHLVRSLGSQETSRPDVLSLLAFDPAYLTALIEIGERDAETHADAIRALLTSRD